MPIVTLPVVAFYDNQNQMADNFDKLVPSVV